MSIRVEEQQQAMEDTNTKKQEMEQAIQEINIMKEEMKQAIQDAGMKNQELDKMIQEAKQEKEQAIQQTNIKKQEMVQVIQDTIVKQQEMEQTIEDAGMKKQELEQAIHETNMKKHEMEETIQEANRRVEMIQQINDTTQQQLQQLTHVLQQHIQESTQRISELEEQLKQENTSVQSHDKIHWVIERDEVQVTQEILGRGGWGEVKVGVFRGTRVAVKCLYEVILSEYNLTLFSREMDIASRVRHPNLLQFIGATTVGNPLILTELMPTSLRKELEKSPLTRPQIISISNDVASALNYLHLWKPQPILHRDVSSANVLLEASGSGRWKGKLSDYGSANLLHQIRTVAPGSPSYAAPEAISPQLHSPAMDIYSFGVLFMEMAIRRLPSANIEEKEAQIQSVQWPTFKILIQKCVTRDKQSRPTIEQVLVDLGNM